MSGASHALWKAGSPCFVLSHAVRGPAHPQLARRLPSGAVAHGATIEEPEAVVTSSLSRSTSVALGVALALATRQRCRQRCVERVRLAATPYGGSEPEFPVLENLRRKGSDMPCAPGEQGSENFEPIAEFKAIKENPIGNWGFLDDTDFLQRTGLLFGAASLVGVLFMSLVFPPFDASVGVVTANVLADFFFAAGLGAVVVTAALLYMGQQWSNVGRALRKSKFTVEYDPTAKMDYTSGPGGAYSYEQVKSQKAADRDRLIAEYDVEPALTRLRSYLAATLLASLALPAVGSSMGAQMSMAPEEDPNESKCKTLSNCRSMYSVAKGTEIQPYIR